MHGIIGVIVLFAFIGLLVQYWYFFALVAIVFISIFPIRRLIHRINIDKKYRNPKLVKRQLRPVRPTRQQEKEPQQSTHQMLDAIYNSREFKEEERRWRVESHRLLQEAAEKQKHRHFL